MKCPFCGTENPLGTQICVNCRNKLFEPDVGSSAQAAQNPPPQPLPQPPLQPQPYPQAAAYGGYPPVARSRIDPKLLIGILAIVAIIIIASIVVLTIPKSQGLNIQSWSTVRSVSGASFTETFTVNVLNYASTSVSGIINCRITFANGDTYFNTKAISLGPQASQTYIVAVVSTNMDHWSQNCDKACYLT